MSIPLFYSRKWVWPEPITESWIYWSSDLGLISLSSNWITWITITDKNLWATTVYNDWDTLSEANCGKYYQWWNNYWFPFTWSVTTSSTQVDASSYWPWNYYSSSTFITRSSTTSSRSSVRNDNLWGWVTWTNEAMQWPCASWYHIPKDTERKDVYNIWVSLWLSNWSRSRWGWLKTYLKIPFAGRRDASSSSVDYQGSDANYWSSITYDASRAYELTANTLAFSPNSANRNPDGNSIRPFANEPVQPTVERTVLYQPS
mgnify:CR=1 FL=1